MADDGIEVLDLGTVTDPPPPFHPAGESPRSRPSRRAILTAAGLTAAAGLAGVVASRRSPPRLDPVEADEVAVTRLGRPLLGGAPVEVFGFDQHEVVRVELATGRVTRTGLAGLEHAALDVVPVRGGVVVHRSDNGPGYLVPDGRPPTGLPHRLDRPGPLLPGPDLDHVWVMTNRSPSAPMTLVGLDGAVVGSRVGVAADLTSYPVPDGGGYPLFFTSSGTYSVGPGGLRLVTKGAVVAGGTPGWLVLECDEQAVCGSTLVRRNGGRLPIMLRPAPPASNGPRAAASGWAAYAPLTSNATPPASTGSDWPAVESVVGGALGPDGRRAALYVGDPARGLRLDLVDLATGTRTATGVELAAGAVLRRPHWSADGRLLVTVDAAGRILAVDAASGRTAPLVPDGVLPPVEDVALRG